MDLAQTRHLMRAQGRGDDVHQQAGPGVEQGQDLGHREPAALGLGGRLAELGLEFASVGHRDGGAVDEPGAMPSPGALGAGLRKQRLDQFAEHAAEDGQGQPGASLGVSRVGEDPPREPGDMLEG
jgi:hypothetical protein